MNNKTLARLLPPVFILVLLLTAVVSVLAVELAKGEGNGKSSLREIDVWSDPAAGSVLDDATVEAIRALPEVDGVEGIKSASIHADSDEGSYVLQARTFRPTEPPPILALAEGVNQESLDALAAGDVIVPEKTQGTNFRELLGEKVPIGFIVEVAPDQGESRPDTVRIAGVYEASYEVDGYAVAYATSETVDRWRDIGGASDPLESDYEQLIVTVAEQGQVATVASTLRNLDLEISVVSERTGDLGGFLRALELAGLLVAFALVGVLGITIAQSIKVTASAMSTTLALYLVTGTSVRRLIRMLRIAVLKAISLWIVLASPLGAIVAYVGWPGAEDVPPELFLAAVFGVVAGVIAGGWFVAGATCKSIISRDLIAVLREE